MVGSGVGGEVLGQVRLANSSMQTCTEWGLLDLGEVTTTVDEVVPAPVGRHQGDGDVHAEHVDERRVLEVRFLEHGLVGRLRLLFGTDLGFPVGGELLDRAGSCVDDLVRYRRVPS